MRIHGRLLRPSNLAERRLLLGQFGTSTLRVPRKYNIFSVARRLERYVKKNADLAFVQSMVKRRLPVPPISPDLDVPEPVTDDAHAAAAE
ncbi:MAG: hypothetical protein KIT84_00550 [Labilithrix sp.]|nr:hypothetical protein [Labilithrix sp.]MCW5809473.1 hypothetical protein [Labilithrix sp.]